MPALVPELINMASDPAVSAGDLLRRALVAARRLDVPELENWINSELTGYKSGEVPDYRIVSGQLFAEHPFRGTIPFIVPPQIAEELTKLRLYQSIPELTQFAQSSRMLLHYFPPDAEQFLMRVMEEGSGYATRPLLKFSSMQVTGVIEIVRSRILNWALDLEACGIVGEGMSFTSQEKQAVQEQH